MNLVPNATTVAWQSYAVRAAAIAAILGLIIHALPNAPDFIKNALPVQNIIATWDWGSGIFTAAGVYIGRIINQGGNT